MSDQDLAKSYRSIAIAWITAVTWALAIGKPWVALSITFGVLLGTAILASNKWVFLRLLQPEAVRTPRRLLKVWLVKYPAMIIVLFVLVRWQRTNVFALCGGVVLVYAAIVLRTLGGMLFTRQADARDVSKRS